MLAPIEGLFTKYNITDTSATCKDGSPGAYYIQLAENGNPDAPWLLWLDGPTNPQYVSWNVTVSSSSLTWPWKMVFSYGPFAKGDASAGFSSYSKSVLIYCSQDFYLGNGTGSSDERGYTIMQSWLAELKPQMASASSVIVGGATIGGAAAVGLM
jgi:hypothetical protein